MVNDNKQAKRVEVLRIQLYDKLSFSPHISNIYKSADNQSSALISLQKFLSLEEKTVSLNNYFMASFFLKCRFSKENRKSSKRSAEVFLQKLRHIKQRFVTETWFFINEHKTSNNTLS